ncbi:hypothetical protein, partial [uncultured Victivallis sp.]|uniref:hypothetical protein n=1 Tax=uncultured Victivallis sp. TaxID=354118 RepID=UPI0025841F82
VIQSYLTKEFFSTPTIAYHLYMVSLYISCPEICPVVKREAMPALAIFCVVLTSLSKRTILDFFASSESNLFVRSFESNRVEA